MNPTTTAEPQAIVAPAPMRPLPLTLKNHGHLMRQVKRTASVAMYTKGGGFEVIRIRIYPGGIMFGQQVEAHEVYPGDEMFGSFGWYYIGPKARELANAKFDACEEAANAVHANRAASVAA